MSVIWLGREKWRGKWYFSVCRGRCVYRRTSDLWFCIVLKISVYVLQIERGIGVNEWAFPKQNVLWVICKQNEMFAVWYPFVGPPHIELSIFIIRNVYIYILIPFFPTFIHLCIQIYLLIHPPMPIKNKIKKQTRIWCKVQHLFCVCFYFFFIQIC